MYMLHQKPNIIIKKSATLRGRHLPIQAASSCDRLIKTIKDNKTIEIEILTNES